MKERKNTNGASLSALGTPIGHKPSPMNMPRAMETNTEAVCARLPLTDPPKTEGPAVKAPPTWLAASAGNGARTSWRSPAAMKPTRVTITRTWI